MMYGYLDESGAPGVATRPDQYLVVSLVLFSNREAVDKCSASIDRLRKRLHKENYEFHFSRNSNVPMQAFIKLISGLDFEFITIAIKKNDFRSQASYQRIAKLLIAEIESSIPELYIEMDTNPVLYAELRRQAKVAGLNVTFKQVRSASSNLIQLADYVAALSSRKIKGSSKAIEQYRPLIKKQRYFSETTK